MGGVDFNTSYHMGFLDMPAIDMEPSLQGDCNLDGRVNINDLTIVFEPLRSGGHDLENG